MKKFLFLFVALASFSLLAGNMTLEAYLKADHDGIKSILSKLGKCEKANYKQMLKLDYKALAKKHAGNVKKFCAGKLAPKHIHYKGKNYKAYMFYHKKHSKCEAGTMWFLPLKDCKKLKL